MFAMRTRGVGAHTIYKSKHAATPSDGSAVLTFCFKLCAAGAAGNLNFPFPAGNPQGLITVGTLEVPVMLIPPDVLLEAEPPGNGLKQREKPRVFYLAFQLIGGEKAEQRIPKHHEGGDRKGEEAGKPCHGTKNKEHE